MNYIVYLEYAERFVTMEMVLCVSLFLNYYLFSKLQYCVETTKDVEQYVSSMEKELDTTRRNVKFYKYCFTTQKRAEKVYKNEIVKLREHITEMETGLKRRVPPLTMTLRERDETGKVKRRKTDSDTD